MKLYNDPSRRIVYNPNWPVEPLSKSPSSEVYYHAALQTAIGEAKEMDDQRLASAIISNTFPVGVVLKPATFYKVPDMKLEPIQAPIPCPDKIEGCEALHLKTVYRITTMEKSELNPENSFLIDRLKDQIKSQTDCDSSYHSGVNDGMYVLLKYLVERGQIIKQANPDKEHFDKELLKELAWKLDREVWAHVPNPDPSEPWTQSKARERTRELIAEYIGDYDLLNKLYRIVSEPKQEPKVETQEENKAVIDFAVWYSGMERQKVVTAYQRYEREVLTRKQS